MKNEFIKLRIDPLLKSEVKHILKERGHIETMSSIGVKAYEAYVKKHEDYLDNFKG